MKVDMASAVVARSIARVVFKGNFNILSLLKVCKRPGVQTG